tara:strand:- start:659 stop:1132 length:474 start_codon:yes stop_codon:yes gene_type:complete
MSLFTLNDDILWIIKDEVSKLRYKQVLRQLNEDWERKKPGRKKYLSFRSIHPGRFFLNENPKNMINYICKTKYYIHGHMVQSDSPILTYIGYKRDTISLKRGLLEKCINDGLDLSSIDMKDEDAIFNINDLVWGFLMKKEEEQIKQNLKTNIQESSK